jgi:hypothetical protein
MYLFEFDNTKPLVGSIVVAIDQLKSDLNDSQVNFDWDIDTLLKYFQKYDIILDKTDLYNMVGKPPLNQVIKNIQGDKIIFVGQEELSPPAVQSTDNKKTVATMAQKALKK